MDHYERERERYEVGRGQVGDMRLRGRTWSGYDGDSSLCTCIKLSRIKAKSNNRSSTALTAAKTLRSF